LFLCTSEINTYEDLPVDQVQPEVQWTALTLLLAAGGLVLTWMRAAGKWVGAKLFDDEKGWVTRLVNKQCEMMDALKTVPVSLSTLSMADEQQTKLLQQIREFQTGQDAKLDAIIDAKLCVNQAFLEYLVNNEPQVAECLRKAAGYLLKAKEN
jgi:hypothetical protein